jgi:hypothetical protein
VSALISFYAGVGTDHAGRKLDDILAWNDGDLEHVHDYIQWLFPNRQRSQFNSSAPLLTDDDVKHFRKAPDLLGGFYRAYERMCKFYKIAIGPPYWWDDLRYAHNWLRMTRIMLSLREFGMDEELSRFHEAISKAQLPDQRTRAYWADAAGKVVP